jgi:nucleoside-diphosphate-sugar epimerase/acyl carrier protein
VTARACVLVTGAAGAIGGPLVSWLAAMPAIGRVFALAHEEAVTAVGAAVTVVAGDVARDAALGMAPADAEAVASEVTAIVHTAAHTRFDSPLADARAVNVGGTCNVLAFARRCPRLDRLVALSTTHVAGRRTGTILEGDLEHEAGFVNTYEASKYEAECEWRAAMREWPIAVARISTVAGDSRSGAVARPRAIHQAVRLMYASLAPMVPGSDDSPVDIAALDHVVRALGFLTIHGFEAGATWHLCAGDDTIPFGELIDLTLATFHAHRPSWRKRAIERPAVVDLATFELFCQSVERMGDPALRAATSVMAHFAPQLAFPKRFDDARCAAALGASGLEKPSARELWARVVTHLIQPPASAFESRLLSFITTHLAAGRGVEIDAETYLFEAGLIDSLKILQLIAFIEKEIGRTIPDRDVVMANFRNVRSMAARFAAGT